MKASQVNALPRNLRVGQVFHWRGRMWRKGRGIVYAAKPCARGIIYEGYLRRDRRRRQAASK